MTLFRTKTFWAGLGAVLVSLGSAAAGFGAEGQTPGWAEIVAGLVQDPKLWIGLGLIFNRHALLKATEAPGIKL